MTLALLLLAPLVLLFLTPASFVPLAAALSIAFGFILLVVAGLFAALLALLVVARVAMERALRSAVGSYIVAVLLLVAICALTGCASIMPHEARRRLVGMSTPDLLACMGPPAERDETVPRLKVWTWSYIDPGSSVAIGSMTALGMGLSLQEHGSCRVIATLSGGHVTSLHYSPASDGIAGPLGACGPILRDCMEFPTVTPLPADFHPDAPEKAAAK